MGVLQPLAHVIIKHLHILTLLPSHTPTPAGDQSDTPTNDKSAARALFSGLDFIGISAYSPLKVWRLSGGGQNTEQEHGNFN